MDSKHLFLSFEDLSKSKRNLKIASLKKCKEHIWVFPFLIAKVSAASAQVLSSVNPLKKHMWDYKVMFRYFASLG